MLFDKGKQKKRKHESTAHKTEIVSNIDLDIATEFVGNNQLDKEENYNTEIIRTNNHDMAHIINDRTEIIGMKDQDILHTSHEKTEMCMMKSFKREQTELSLENKASENKTDIINATESRYKKTEINLTPNEAKSIEVKPIEVKPNEVTLNEAKSKEQKKIDPPTIEDSETIKVIERTPNKQIKPRKPVKKASFILRLLDRENGGRVFEKTVTDVLVIGRKSELCDLAISYDKTISARQCKVFIKRRKLYVTDLGGTNITHLNGYPIEGEKPISSGDVLSLGRINLRITVTKNT